MAKVVDPQGHGVPETPPGETDSPASVTEERVSELVNRAITARFASFEKKVGNQVSEAVAGLFPKFEELIAQKVPSQGPAPSAEPKLDDSPLVKGLQKQLAELQEQNRKSREERDVERQRARDVALRQRLTEELSKHGIDSRYARQAIGFLVDAEKRVRWADDEGESLVFRDADGSELDLQTGLRSWAKTDDAKIYMPPRGVSGSGDRGGGASPKPINGQGIKRGDIGRALLSEFGLGIKASE